MKTPAPPVCYAQPGKATSRTVLEAFAAGSGGRLSNQTLSLEPGPSAFYGVVGLEHLLRLSWASDRDWWYGDNAYFDAARKKFFRFARNAFQLARPLPPDHDRLRRLGISVRPWQRAGAHVVVVAQSAHFLDLTGQRAWVYRVVEELRARTSREIRVRLWSRDKAGAASSLGADLRGAWALVTHMSAAANEALVAGIPVFVSGDCAAKFLASGPLTGIESPRYPEGREEWAAGLANSQWTLEELREGRAWRALNGEGLVQGSGASA